MCVEQSETDRSTFLHLLTDVPHISQAPVLMLRPRAWNMVEHNMMVVHSVTASLDSNAAEVVDFGKKKAVAL